MKILIEFSFVGTGIAKIRRLNDNELKDSKKIKLEGLLKKFFKKNLKIF